MTTPWKALTGLVLASVLAIGNAQTQTDVAPTTHKKDHARRAHRAVPRRPSVESQLEQLRQDMDAQHTEIDSLKQQLSQRESELQQAQQAAAAAQSAAQQAQQAAQTQQTAISTSNQSVTALQGAVADLKTNTQATLATVRAEQTKVHQEIENPEALHYKGITISPNGSFIEAATVYRSAATGGDINTQFTGIPLQHSDQAQLSEFFGSGRQSRVAIKASGVLANVKLTGYYEADWLGAGVTSNNNQSNSYVLRERQLWAQAALNSGWNFTGGAMWSLATETTQGLENGTEILPGTIDPQYTAGFVWARQYGFRIAKNFGNKFWIGASAENPQTLPVGSSPTNQLLGQAGNGGGLYNLNANYSYNLAPDMIAKIAWEPGWGHYELFGIARFFRNRVYPNAPASAAGAYNDSTVGGGIGGSLRVPLASKKITFGLKGLYGDGTGRYGDSTIGDITFRPDGQISLLHNFSALETLEFNPNKRLNIYTNYGGDYVGRDIHGNSGYGLYTAKMSGCGTEPLPGGTFTPATPSNCAGNTKDVQEATAGYWFYVYSGAKGRLRQGVQYSYFTRNLWSGAGGPANPNGGAKGTDNIFETSLRYYLP